ncbi:MAG: glycosyltransferase family 2 protein [Deltaproteobacteria bacterium]|nr:glycosyltransferase family 2 protein [Deltaproteobacteria bacterium]
MIDKTIDESCHVSVVIPVFNEEDNLEPLIDELQQVLDKLGKKYEVIFIDDKSTDDSLEVMKKLRETRPFLRIFPHRLNSGESAGQATGFAHANGEIIITMDADQQNDPADIPFLLDALKENIAAVCGVRRKRMDTIVKRISSRTWNVFRNIVTGDKISDGGCTYRAIRRSALCEIQIFNGMHRFIPTLLRLQGYEVVEIPINDRPRTRGYSKYGVRNRIWRGITDCFAIYWLRKRSIRGDRIGPEYHSQ